jgi:GMP synthase-like glutamine amidotransferase
VRIVCLQHVAFEGPAAIGPWAAARRHAIEVVRLDLGRPPADADTADWLVVLGGPMGVHDERTFPWLVPEKRVIEKAISKGRPVLGVCLGAQMVAQVLGARVHPGRAKEIGWHEVRATPEARGSKLFGFLPPAFPAFHWHGDTFDIPAGAVRTAQSDAFANQAFEYGSRVAALQFHLEATADSVARLVAAGGGELAEGGPGTQSAAQILRPDAPLAALAPLLEALLDAMERRATG